MQGRSVVTHKVLVHCCDERCREDLSDILAAEIFTLSFVPNREDMLLGLLESDYDLVVYGMERVDPDDVKILKILKKMRPKVPVIVISSDPSSERGGKILQEGVVYYAVKPYNPEAIKSVIYSTLGEVTAKN
jgi:DNA-binding NtrC family response regulator